MYWDNKESSWPHSIPFCRPVSLFDTQFNLGVLANHDGARLERLICIIGFMRAFLISSPLGLGLFQRIGIPLFVIKSWEPHRIVDSLACELVYDRSWLTHLRVCIVGRAFFLLPFEDEGPQS